MSLVRGHRRRRRAGSADTLADWMVPIASAQASLGLTDDDFAKACGLPAGTIGQLRQGHVTNYALTRIVNFLESKMQGGTNGQQG